MSAMKPARPVPSTTRPFLIRMSYCGGGEGSLYESVEENRADMLKSELMTMVVFIAKAELRTGVTSKCF